MRSCLSECRLYHEISLTSRTACCRMVLVDREPGVGMSESIGSSALSRMSRLLKLVLLTSMLAFASDTKSSKATTILAPGGRIDVFVARAEAGVTHEDLIGWVSAASKSVATYFGHYPVPHVAVRITTSEGRGVHNGRTFGSPVALVTISVGRKTTLADL